MLSEKELLDAVVRYHFETFGRRPDSREVVEAFNRGLASRSYPPATPLGAYLVKVGSMTSYEVPTSVPPLPRFS